MRRLLLHAADILCYTDGVRRHACGGDCHLEALLCTFRFRFAFFPLSFRCAALTFPQCIVATPQHLRDNDLWVNRACKILSTRVRSLPPSEAREPGHGFRAEARVKPEGVRLPPGKKFVTAFWGRDGAYSSTETEASRLAASVTPGELVACFARRKAPLTFSIAKVPRIRAPTEDVYLNMAWGSSFFAAISGFLVIAISANFCQRGLLAALGPEGVAGEPDPDSKRPVCLTSPQARYIMHRFAESGHSDAWTCSICLDDEEKGAPTRSVVLPCGHRYHARCIRKWLRRGAPTCPLCNWNVAGLFDEAGEPVPEDGRTLFSLGKPAPTPAEESRAALAVMERVARGESVVVDVENAITNVQSEGEDDFADIAVPAPTADTHP